MYQPREGVGPNEGLLTGVVVVFPGSTSPDEPVKDKLRSQLRPGAFQSARQLYWGFSLAENSTVGKVL